MRRHRFIPQMLVYEPRISLSTTSALISMDDVPPPDPEPDPGPYPGPPRVVSVVTVQS